MTEQCIKIICKTCNTVFKIPDIDPDKTYSCNNCQKLISVHPVTDFLESMGEFSYLNFLRQNLKVRSYSYMRETIENLIAQLPYHINESIEWFIDGLYLMYNRHNYFWSKMTCKEAFRTISRIALETLPFNGIVTSIKEMEKNGNQPMAYLLFKIASINYAYIESITREKLSHKIINKIIPVCQVGNKRYNN